MKFQEMVFKNKGWMKTEGKAKANIITVLRSDMLRKSNYCMGFYTDIVDALDVLDFRRTSTSIDLDEVSCKMIVQNYDPELVRILEERMKFGDRPTIFVGENSPIAYINMCSFTEHVVSKYKITDYAIVRIGPFSKNLEITVYGKDGKSTDFYYNASTKTFKEVTNVDI